ncbi:MAG: hypothetical protein D3910_23935 [Candidatus Electrothrix sp. ATG2]|nr:hypothetical protein [Candidatus Electrothrix sp. ATG2]
MKERIEFELDGQPVYIEAEVSEPEGMRRVGRGGDDTTKKAELLFVDAVNRIKPAAEVVLNAFQEMNTPDEIALEFGLNFSAKAGAIFTSADSAAAFKVSLKWTNKK